MQLCRCDGEARNEGASCSQQSGLSLARLRGLAPTTSPRTRGSALHNVGFQFSPSPARTHSGCVSASTPPQAHKQACRRAHPFTMGKFKPSAATEGSCALQNSSASAAADRTAARIPGSCVLLSLAGFVSLPHETDTVQPKWKC